MSRLNSCTSRSTPISAQTITFDEATTSTQVARRKISSKHRHDEVCDYIFCSCMRYQQIDVRYAVCLQSMAVFIQSMFFNGMLGGFLTTIERRYELTAVDMGLFSVLFDIGQLLLIIPVSTLGSGHCRKMRVESIGLCVMGVAVLLFASPQFLASSYNPNAPVDPVCNASVGLENTICLNKLHAPSLKSYKWIFWTATCIFGMGCSPIYTLGTAYIDENSSMKKGYLYFAVMNSNIFFGSAFGQFIVGRFLNIYIDLHLPEGIHVTHEDRSSWLGAWWFGPILTSVACFLLAVPLFGLPVHMPNSGGLRRRSGKRVEKDVDKRHSLALSFKLLLENSVIIFVACAMAFELLFFTGLNFFGPKYMEITFAVSKSLAPTLIGGATVIAGGSGTLVGGIISRCANFNIRMNHIMLTTLSLFNMLPLVAFSISCPQELALMTDHSACNARCECHAYTQLALFGCGADDRNYFSPCFAGCTVSNSSGYFNCQCLADHSNRHFPEWRDGYCPVQCGYRLPIFILIICLEVFTTCMLASPAIITVLHSVPNGLQSLAMGLCGFASRILGSMPAPLIFAALIDASCASWSMECGIEGHCVDYDRRKFRLYFFTVIFACKCLSALCFGCSFISFRYKRHFVVPPGKKEGF